ncbi:MAG: hypothetical protein ACR2JY_15580 [Chloroflexota bacterium]
MIQEQDVNAIYLAGRGHGGPALLASVYLERSYAGSRTSKARARAYKARTASRQDSP